MTDEEKRDIEAEFDQLQHLNYTKEQLSHLGKLLIHYTVEYPQ